MKKLIIMIIAGAMTLSSCDNQNKKAEETKHDSSHAHEYSCPMHPEVTGHEGEKCPKCGMALEKTEHAKSGNKYKMEFSSEPAELNAGKEATLKFTPKIEGKNEQVPLDIEHEKKIHLIMVSEDLSWFDHQHPEYNSDGSYSLKYNFPNGGKHILFADYKPSGAGHQLEKTYLDIAGKSIAAKTFRKEKLTAGSGDYEFELKAGKFESGKQLHIQGIVKKNGKLIDPNSLENYLGAKAHVVVISVEDKNYLHVHPDVANSAFDLHATFDKPGIYRAWIQFQADGKIHTTDFVIEVVQGSGNADQQDHKEHEGHNH